MIVTLVKSALDSRNGGNFLLKSERRSFLIAVVLLNKKAMKVPQRVSQNIPSWPTKMVDKDIVA